MLALLPYKAEPKAREVLAKAGLTLGNWLKGQLFAMAVVAILTLIALSIIGIPMALALAIIAGLLNFIPNFGPLIAMIPAVLVGLMEGPRTALIVAATYIIIQTIESNFITPTVQNKLINMPPALILIGQLFMGALTGAWGIILATPVVALIIVIIKEVYLKEKKKPIETVITDPQKPAPAA
jgi:predicted PurR-regulated permease PerM